MASPLIQLHEPSPEPESSSVLVGGVYRHLDTGQEVVVLDHEYRLLKVPRRSLALLFSPPAHRIRTGRYIVQSTFFRFEKPFIAESDSLEVLPSYADRDQR